MGNFTKNLNTHLHKKDKTYKRLLLQTYFTAPEWRNVEMAEELGKFMVKNNPFYRFPYFKQIFTFWFVFIQSYRSAKKHHSHRDLIFSEYMVMNLFVGISTTIGFLTLGILSLFFYPLMKNKNETAFQKFVGNVVIDYSNFIHTVPFFNYPFLSKVKPLWLSFKQSQHKTFADIVTFVVAEAELLVRSVLSVPIAWWYNQPQNQSADILHLIVQSHKNEKQIQKIDENITLHQKFYKKSQAREIRHYSHITIPRYDDFAMNINKLVDNDIKIKRISGQKRIQFKLLVPEGCASKLTKYHTLYSYKNHIDKKLLVFIDVPTSELNHTIKTLRKDNIKIKLMHDF